MGNTLILSSSPHIRGRDTTQRIMIDVVIALVPAIISGVRFFGPRVLAVLLTTVVSCVLWEYLSEKAMKRRITISDFSAVVTGVLLALNLPPSIPLWIAAVGGFVAIVLIKQLFGGIGQNFMNPALGARVILMLSWTQQMTNWTNPLAPDAVSSATPLAVLKKGHEIVDMVRPDYLQFFLGHAVGSIGETSVLALLIGGLYLIYRKVISPVIPLSFIGSAALFGWIFGGNTPFTGDFLYHILAGGIILGAFFMATDYSTSPVTTKGRIIMGIGCGIITSIIRLYANYPEGVSFAILLMNVLTPMIDKYTIPATFGGEGKVGKHI
ncbi:MAG TPA: RnfABCDGE type electron transport complex subunit D [Clostridiales bacterium]|nr:RnfABCDGE type electron transport complex subunit D [Clostridiales bacterium]